MKINHMIGILLITGGMMTASLKANSEQIRIRSVFNIKSAYCSIKTNGIQGLNNRNSAYSGSGGGISSTNSLLFLENGENEISIDIGALAWFDDKRINNNVKPQFSLNSSCKLDLTRFLKEEKKILSSIDVKINNQGTPEAITDTDGTITRKKTLAEEVEPGHIDPEYFDPLYFPKKMELYTFSKKIIIQGVPEWKWISTKPFSESEEEIQKLRMAYTEMAQIINSKDRNKLKEFDHVALQAWSTATGESEDDILESQYSKEKLEGGKAKIEKIKWNDYALRIMNKGRIIQYYNKSNPIFSPLTYYTTDKDGDVHLASFAPMFSFINGKFVPVI